MTNKAAYVWGPISSFSGPLVAYLLKKGWHVHIATKSALNLFSLSPLDLPSKAQASIEKALGGHDQYKTFQERLKFIDTQEPLKDAEYEALIFCPLPPNFDEARAPRAPWAAQELGTIAKALRGVNVYLVSSLWGGIQEDGVVPEEMEFARRKPKSNWEHSCQQYEIRLLKELPELESTSHLVRLPLISGSTTDGTMLNFSGPYTLLRELAEQTPRPEEHFDALKLHYNPDSTFWFLPADQAVKLFWQILEAPSRPRVCNLVSTQATLNREYAQSVASSLGYKKVEVSQFNAYKLSGTLRTLLNDNILVKTRNLFEVAGRLNESPVSTDQEYFEKLLQFGRENNWGRVGLTERPAPKLEFSAGFAKHYFEEFLPMHFDAKLLHEVTKGDISVGFVIDGPQQLSWVLRATNGQAFFERLDHGSIRPKVSLHFTGETMMRLVSKKLSMEQALVVQEVRVEGPLLAGLRISNIFGRFLKKNPYTEENAVPELAASENLSS